MKSFLVLICLPFLLYCKPRDYFFVPTMRAYNRMLCRSGVPGTENPLICPQNSLPLQYAPPVLQLPNSYSVPRIAMMSTDFPVGYQQRNALDNSNSVPLIPVMSSKREERIPPLPEAKPKKIYLIPWESQGEKPLINYILVPDELLSPNAPLDTLDEEPRLRLKVNHHKIIRTRGPKHTDSKTHVHHIHHYHPKPQKKPKSSKYSHERQVKEFRSVDSGHDGQDYDSTAIE